MENREGRNLSARGSELRHGSIVVYLRQRMLLQIGDNVGFGSILQKRPIIHISYHRSNTSSVSLYSCLCLNKTRCPAQAAQAQDD